MSLRGVRKQEQEAGHQPDEASVATAAKERAGAVLLLAQGKADALRKRHQGGGNLD